MRRLISALALVRGYRFTGSGMIRSVSMGLLLVGSLSGCAAQLAVDASDPCGQPRDAFGKSRTLFADRVAGNVVAGALAGCAAGAVIGAITHTSAGRNCAAGAVGGAAAGLATAYWQNLQQQTADQQVLAQTVNSDLATESTNVTHIAAAFADLRSCRFAQASQVRFAVRRGQMSRPEAQQRLAQEGIWFNEELNLAQAARLSMAKRDEQFAYAAGQLPPPPAPPPVPGRRDRRGRPLPKRPSDVQTAAASGPVTTGTLLQQRNSFETSVQAAQRQSVAAFNLDASTSTQRDRLHYG